MNGIARSLAIAIVLGLSGCADRQPVEVNWENGQAPISDALVNVTSDLAEQESTATVTHDDKPIPKAPAPDNARRPLPEPILSPVEPEAEIDPVPPNFGNEGPGAN